MIEDNPSVDLWQRVKNMVYWLRGLGWRRKVMKATFQPMGYRMCKFHVIISI